MGRALFSVPTQRWEAFGKLTDNRAAVLRDFIDWYLRIPGAKMPKRPPAPESD